MNPTGVVQPPTRREAARLIPPHGGALVDLLAPADRRSELLDASRNWPSWDVTPRQLCDLELLTNGGFSPLGGFLCRADYESVCASMRLTSGLLWPIPVVLDVPEDRAKAWKVGQTVALRDPEGLMLAALHVEEIWQPDRMQEALSVYGSDDPAHPGVAYLLRRSHAWQVGGLVEAVQLPVHHDFRPLRLTPADLRAELARLGWERLVAFQTRNPMHRAHFELTLRAARQAEARLLIHPSVGMTKPGDVDHYTRVRCYRALLEHYPPDTARLALLPLAMRMAGPREALWHAILRKNFGCTHFIVGRDHAGPGNDSSGKPFYGPYDAQQLLRKHQKELGVSMIPFRRMLYLPARDVYLPDGEVAAGVEAVDISGTELRARLAEGREIPPWFTFPEVAKELRRTYPARSRQGFTVFFTGLSGSGKSTIANSLLVRLLERGGRSVTLLDGDLVRKHLSSELGFSKEHRDINIRRIGFVAAEVTRSGGIALCAPIAPYDAVRREVRAMVEGGGGFILVHVAAPLSVCEQRDRKGLYAKARAGILTQFTGISDPYEEPADAEIRIDTSCLSPGEAVESILRYLTERGYLTRSAGIVDGE